MRATVIINPVAGPGRSGNIGACGDLARSVLAAQNYQAEIKVTGGPTDAHRFAVDAVAAGHDLVIAWGGDGTVNGAASAVAGTRIPLGIVPAGSGNGLARDLSIPLDPAQALAVAATGRTRSIDAGDLNGSLFFNVAGIGLDARIAGRLATVGHRRGLLGYVFATVAELREYRPCSYSIRRALDVDGRAIDDIVNHPALFIALANSRQYGNGAQIAPKALLDDGMMEVVIIEPQSSLSIVRQVPAFFRGTLREGPGILMRSAAALEVHCAEGIRFHVDGEPREGATHVALQTRRGILMIKVSDSK
jgi:diacylglycerol kinase (ATP)